MKLITKSIEKKLEKAPFFSTEGLGLDANVIVKFFGGSAATWLVTEAYDHHGEYWEFFGCVTLDGHNWEYGYFMLSELEALRFPPFGLPVERDMYFHGTLKDAGVSLDDLY